MVSNLTVETPIKPPDTARELVDRGEYVAGGDSQTCNLLAANPDPDFKDLTPKCKNFAGNFGAAITALGEGEVVLLESGTYLNFKMRSDFTNE